MDQRRRSYQASIMLIAGFGTAGLQLAYSIA